MKKFSHGHTVAQSLSLRILMSLASFEASSNLFASRASMPNALTTRIPENIS